MGWYGAAGAGAGGGGAGVLESCPNVCVNTPGPPTAGSTGRIGSTGFGAGSAASSVRSNCVSPPPVGAGASTGCDPAKFPPAGFAGGAVAHGSRPTGALSLGGADQFVAGAGAAGGMVFTRLVNDPGVLAGGVETVGGGT